MTINTVHHGDCLSLFKELENESIDCVITSPPYWQLRDYKWDGQWGLENTYQLYLVNLWTMMCAVHRVLKPAGTVWINLGDTYGSTKTGNTDNKHRGNVGQNINKVDGIQKCLMLIPHRFAIGCIDRGWIVRNDIIWAKRNGMPESVTDRFSKKHEYFFLMVKQEKYYFDLDGIRDSGDMTKDGLSRTTAGLSLKSAEEKINPLGKNPGSVSDFWDVPTQPSFNEHYAAYNDSLIGKPIVAGCPPNGIILDPFAGTATTGCRALELGRNFIGFEGSKKFVSMANKNLEPYIRQTKLF
jgi:DNA modification methylase